jgi:hypothetical protein
MAVVQHSRALGCCSLSITPSTKKRRLKPVGFKFRAAF